MNNTQKRQDEMYQDLLAQSQGKNVISVSEAQFLTGKSWSTLNRDMAARKLRYSQPKTRGKRTILLRDLVRYIDGDFEF